MVSLWFIKLTAHPNIQCLSTYFTLLLGSWVKTHGRVRFWLDIAAQGLRGTGRWTLEPGGLQSAGAGAEGAAADEEDADDTATRSHEGHIVRVVGGFICM
jgi:hypothetical protein